MKRRKNTIATFMLIMSLFMTSCSREEDVIYMVEGEAIPDYDKKTELDEIEKKHFERNHYVENVIQEIDDVPVQYKYLDAYPQNNEIDTYVESVSLETHCKITTPVDKQTLYKRISENTQEQLKRYSNCSNPFEEKDFCNAIETTLSNLLHEENDLSEDLHRLSGTSILILNDTPDYLESKKVEEIHILKLARDEMEFIMGEYREEENMILLYKSGLNAYYNSFVFEGSYQSYYSIILPILLHEVNHLRESICDCRIEQGATTYRGIDYNGDYVPSLSESSCESALYLMDLDPYENEKVYNDYSYPYERKAEMYLMFLALFNDNAKSEDYYYAMFDTDLNALYNFFGLESREDIYDFYHILYTMDTLNFRTTLSEQFDEENIQNEIGETYRIDIMKRTLMAMVEYTNHHPEFTLEENLLLYQIVKNYLTDEAYGHVLATSPSGLQYYANTYDINFIQSLESLESIYTSFLVTYYDTTYEEITMLKKEKIEKKYYVLSYSVNSGESVAPQAIQSLIERFPILHNIMTKYELPYTAYENYIAKGKVYVNLKS